MIENVNDYIITPGLYSVIISKIISVIAEMVEMIETFNVIINPYKNMVCQL